MRNTPGVLQGGSVPESGSSYENTRLPTNPPPPLQGRAGVGGKNPRQVQNRDKTLKIPFIFAAVTPHPNPPPQGGREPLLIIMLLINNMQMWVIGCIIG